MSIYLMDRVFNTVDLPANKKIVLVKLADHADDAGFNARPSVGKLAKRCGVSKRLVQRFLKEWRTSGVLQVVQPGGGKGRPTHYRLMLAQAQALHPMEDDDDPPKGDARTPFENGKGDAGAPFENGKGDAGAPFENGKGDAGALKGESEDAKGAQACHPNHQNHQESNARASSPEPAGDAGPAEPEAPSPASEAYNRPWREKQAEIEAELDPTEYGAWIKGLIPVDPGAEVDFYQLGAATRFIADHVERKYGAALGRVLGRPVRLVVFNLKLEADKRRAARAKEAKEARQAEAPEPTEKSKGWRARI
jgi:hypothetical protein